MTNLLTERQREFPPQMAAGEREFAAEPVDAAWAPGAEADVLAKFAQMPGLKLIDLQVGTKSVAYLWREGLAPQQHPGEPHEPN